jgi:hypothetical protein
MLPIVMAVIPIAAVLGVQYALLCRRMQAKRVLARVTCFGENEYERCYARRAYELNRRTKWIG